MADLVLYTNPMSRGRIARWMLEEVGVDYRVQMLDYGAPMKSEAYLRLNPMGKVPTLVHGASAVTEAAAICAYLADVFPEAGLAPPPPERGAYYRWLFFAAGPLEAAIVNTALRVTPTAEQEAMVGYGTLARVLDTLEAKLADGRPFLTGETFTAADLYLSAQIGWGLMFGTIEERPGFRAYHERAATRPAAQRAKAADDALMPEPAAPGR